jgi:ATP-dependent Clp protease adaptor protein ClpS
VAEELSTAVMEPPVRQQEREQETKRKPKKAPRFHVVLWDDSDHSYEYVQIMMMEVFGMPLERGYEIAWRVDKSGRAIVLTTSKEHGELKVEQIHSYGADPLIPRSKGSMTATLQQVEE